MSFVPEQEAPNFDMQVTTTPLHCSFYPLKLGGFGVGSAVQRHAAAPWRAWQSIIPTLTAAPQSPDTDTLFNAAPRLRAQQARLQTTLSLQMNKPVFLLKPLGALKATQKKQVSTVQRNLHKQLLDSLTTTPFERSVLLSQSTSDTGAHLMQPSSEAYEAEDRCFRVVAARRLMLPPSSTSTDQSHTWMSPLLLLPLAIRLWSQQPAPDHDTWPKELIEDNFDRYLHINLVPFILETTGRPGPHARKFISNLVKDADNPPLAIRDTWSAIQSVLHSAISKQQLTAAVT